MEQYEACCLWRKAKLLNICVKMPAEAAAASNSIGQPDLRVETFYDATKTTNGGSELRMLKSNNHPKGLDAENLQSTGCFSVRKRMRRMRS